MARIDDGFPTTVDIFDTVDDMDGPPLFQLFYEKTVKPPGIDGGGANNTTTMRNSRWRTMNSKKLITLSEMTLKVAYDTELYDSILEIAQLTKWFVINFPDGSKYGFYGFVDAFDPSEITEGAQPEADIKIQPTNQDPEGVEAAPQYFEAT